MRNIDVRLSAASLGLLLTLTHCHHSSEAPPAQGGYPPPTPGTSTVTQAPGYRDGTVQPAPVLAAAPSTAAPPAGTLSQPNPLALPCASDAQCLTHRCNTAFGKCAWPCQTDRDCSAGSVCIAPTCLPKLQ